MRLIDADALIAEYDRVHVGAPGGARKLMENAPTIEAVPVQEWISVNDRLPETDEWVLVCRKTIKTGYTTMVVDRCAFTVSGGRVWLGDTVTYKQVVTHWMPLPQPPKGD